MQRSGVPDTQGLVTTWRELQFRAEQHHFPAPDYRMRVTCEALPPSGVPLSTLTSPPSIARLLSTPQQRNVVDNQRLHWLSGKASRQDVQQGFTFVLAIMYLPFCIFYP